MNLRSLSLSSAPQKGEPLKPGLPWMPTAAPTPPLSVGPLEGVARVGLRLMTDRLIDVFFYGLFMDVDILREKGVTPVNSRPASVEGFALRIGERATLLPSPEARAFGMLISLTHRELGLLYCGPGLEHYRPEAVLVKTFEGERASALCYNLADAPLPHERNPEYAACLQRVLRKLNFPPEYVASVF